MKTPFLFALGITLSISGGLAQSPGATTPKPPGTFFQRFFGTDGPVNPSAKPVEPARNTVAAEPVWELHKRDRLPEGVALVASQLATWPVDSVLENPNYLIGQFVVTASGPRRAILRPLDGPTDVRVVVEYVPAATVPAESMVLLLEQGSGLLIRRITRNQDGSATVFARETLQP